MSNSTDTRDLVRKHYASAARRVGRGAIPLPAADPITRDLYQGEQTAQLPRQALEASLGCGNPTMLAELRPGQVVLDLGSGGGIDVLLSARRVGPEGHVYGLDMTDEMLALARRNQAEAGVENVTFLAGEIEAIPLPDRSVDVVISNCVINLSADKDRVLREAFRVLRPGGLFAVSDMVLTKPLPDALRRSAELWAGCVSGALLESEYRDKLAAAGFQSIEIVPTRVFGACDVDALRSGSCCSVELTDGEGQQLDLAALDGALISAFVRARRLP